MNVRINRWLDFLDRVGWTAIYAVASAGIILLTGDNDLTWALAGKFLGAQVLLAVCKVVLAQRAGSNDLGAAVPGQVIESGPR